MGKVLKFPDVQAERIADAILRRELRQAMADRNVRLVEWLLLGSGRQINYQADTISSGVPVVPAGPSSPLPSAPQQGPNFGGAQ